MESTYQIILSVELLHEYYADSKCSDIRIVPSEETKVLLKNAGVLYKMVGNQFLLISQIRQDLTPYKPLPKADKWVFYLDLLNPEFMNTSSFNLSRFRKERFYFSNLSQNISDSTLYLSAEIQSYDAAKTYFPGDMATGAGSQTYECIKETTGNATSNSDYWISRDLFRYATDADFIKVTKGNHTFEINTPTNIFTINVFGFNPISGNFDTPALNEEVIYIDSTLTSNQAEVNLSNLSEGKYRVNINGQDFWVYVSPYMIHSSKLGVLEIFTHLANGLDYALLDSNGKVWALNTTIRFANRRAYWMYHTPKLKVENIKVSGSNPAVHPFTAFSTDPVNAPSRKDYFLSNQPMLMSQSPDLNNFQLELVDTSNTDLPKAPKPEPYRSGILTKKNSDYFVHIHLNF